MKWSSNKVKGRGHQGVRLNPVNYLPPLTLYL